MIVVGIIGGMSAEKLADAFAKGLGSMAFVAFVIGLAKVISLVLAVVLSPLAFRAVGNLFWFFTYRFTISPILIVAPIFALLGILVPLAVYRSVAKSTIVERLREAEA